MPRLLEDLAGRRFGRLTVLHYSHAENNSVRWLCLCDCGNQKAVAGSSLRRGTTRSCGCLKRETTSARNFRHGLSRTPTYFSWQNMLKRVSDPAHPRWADWGGRGITVCDRWRDYRNFFADMGEKPSGTTLDRINNDGNYEPGNCRWATHAEQAVNKTGFKLTPSMVADIQRLSATGLTMTAIAKQVRLNRHTVSKALWKEAG